MSIKPAFCCFGIIDNCNFKCKMCHKWKEDVSIKGRSRASVGAWKRAIDSLRNITDKGFLIHYGGGEPLLMKELWELVEYSSKKGFSTNVASNGSLIDRDMAKKIGDSGLTLINLSLDSLDELKHDYLRGHKGAFSGVQNAIDLLDYSAPKLKKGICTVISHYNFKDILALMDWVNNDKRLDWIDFMVVVQPNNTVSKEGWYKEEFAFLWPKSYEDVCSCIDEIIRVKKKGGKVANSIPQLEAFKSYFRSPDIFVKKGRCNMDRAVHISSVGDVFICYHWGLLGNIEDDDLSVLWRSKKSGKVREQVFSCKENCHFLLNCYFEGDVYPFQVIER